MVQHAMPRPGPRPAPPATPPPSPILLARKPGPSITAPLIDAGLPMPTAPSVPDVPVSAKDAELSLAYRSETSARETVAHEFAYEGGDLHDAIGSVVTGVVKSFVASATPDELGGLYKARPSIPREVDRALLLDLAHQLNDYDLSDAIRNHLRDHFWEVFDRVSV
jgi:hypothetical protein